MLEPKNGQKPPEKSSPSVQVLYRNQSGVVNLVGREPLMFAKVENGVNRTSVAPHGRCSSYEDLTGQAPRVMSIMPWSCRAWAVKQTRCKTAPSRLHGDHGHQLGQI